MVGDGSDNAYVVVNISSSFSRKFEVAASGFVENLKKIFPHLAVVDFFSIYKRFKIFKISENKAGSEVFHTNIRNQTYSQHTHHFDFLEILKRMLQNLKKIAMNCLQSINNSSMHKRSHK